MNTKEVCNQLSVTPKMLRVYEKQGLIKAARSDSNYRDYEAEDLLRIQTIILLKNLGFPLKEIKKIIEINVTENKYLQSLYMQEQAVEAQLENLKQVSIKLTTMMNRLLLFDETNIPPINEICNYGEETYDKISERLLKQWNFDEMAVNYVERYLKEDVGYRLGITEIAQLLNGMEGTFVDVGGGTCNLWKKISPKKLLVIDSSLQMLLVAKTKVPWARFAVANLLQKEQLKAFGSFDTVVSTFTLHHTPYEQQFDAIRNLLSLCNSGGTVILADRCFQNQKEKDQVIFKLEQEGDLAGLERIIYEYYLLLDDIQSYIKVLGARTEVLFFDNFTVGLVINK